MRSRLWLLYLAAVVLTAIGYFASEPTARAFVYPLFGISAAAAVALCARTSANPRGWLLLAGGIATIAAGDVAFYLGGGATEPPAVPSAVDAFYLVGYLWLIPAAWLVTGRRSFGVALESAIIGLCAFLAAWVFVLRDDLAHVASNLQLATLLAYAVADVCLLAVLARFVFAGRHPDRRIATILAGAALLVVGDTLYASAIAGGTYVDGSVIDVFWIGAYALWGAAGLMRLEAAPAATPAARVGLTALRVTLLAGAILGVHVLLAFQHDHSPLDRAVLFGGTTSISLLVLARAWGLARRQERLLHAARSSQARLHELLGTIDALVTEDEADGTLTHLSGDVGRITGHDADALRDPKAWAAAVPAEDRERIERLRDEALATRTGFVTDYRFRRTDGEVRWLRLSSRVVADGASYRTRSVTVDVTELKEAVAGEQRYREMLESVALVAVAIDASGRVTFANDFLRELTGWAREDALGHDWFERFDDDADARRDFYERMAKGTIRPHFESTIRTRSGERRTIRWSSTLDVRPDGSPAGIVAIGEDVTEQRSADEHLRRREEHFRSLIENASDVITLLDLDGTILYESPSIERVIGWPVDALIGECVFDYIHPDDLDAVQATFAAGVASGSGVWRTRSDFRFRCADGSWCRFESTGQVREDEAGRPFVVVNSRDVTERRELEEQLRHAQKLEAVGRLAGGVAHDFNNLLTGIGGYTEFLLDGIGTDDPRRADVIEIARATERATALTSQLLAFSRRQVLQPEVLDVADVVRNLENLLGRLLGADVDLRTIGQDGCFAHVDRGQLEQVITNLVVNARDAMPGGGTLAIETRRVDGEEGGHVELSVTDTGVGMDEGTIERAFEPFFTTKEKGKGTGLGLSTVYGIVTQSGGGVSVSSDPGIGTTFSVRLPLTEAPAAARVEPAVAEAEHGAETILLAEDEDMIRRLVRDVLTRSGYTVLDAPAGEPALELLRTHEDVDLLLTDVVMPGMNGPALAKVACAERPSLRVLYMSGYTNQPEDVFGHPDAAFIGKPFSPQALVAKVRDVLERRDVAV